MARENEPKVPYEDPYSDMTTEEKSQLLMAQATQMQADKRRMDSLLEKIERFR